MCVVAETFQLVPLPVLAKVAMPNPWYVVVRRADDEQSESTSAVSPLHTRCVDTHITRRAARGSSSMDGSSRCGMSNANHRRSDYWDGRRTERGVRRRLAVGLWRKSRGWRSRQILPYCAPGVIRRQVVDGSGRDCKPHLPTAGPAFGDDGWVRGIAARPGLESTLRQRG